MELRPKRKALFLIMAVCIAFSLVLAETLAADDHDHDCIGEGCPICLQIEVARAFLKIFKMVSLSVFLAVLLPVFTGLIRQRTREFIAYPQSPVALKVRFIF